MNPFLSKLQPYPFERLRALLAVGNYEEALLRNYVMGLGYQ